MKARQMDEAEEILDVVFPSGNEAAEVVHPGEQPFHFPPPSVAAQLSRVLSFASAPSIGRNHVYAVFLRELLIERIGIVGLIADQPRRQFIEEAPGKNLFASWHSAGEAPWTDTARGRLLSAAIATILVPLPGRVGPTAKPLFWRSQKWHRRTLRPNSVALRVQVRGQQFEHLL